MFLVFLSVLINDIKCFRKTDECQIAGLVLHSAFFHDMPAPMVGKHLSGY